MYKHLLEDYNYYSMLVLTFRSTGQVCHVHIVPISVIASSVIFCAALEHTVRGRHTGEEGDCSPDCPRHELVSTCPPLLYI